MTTNPKIVFIVVIAMALFCAGGMIGVFVLILHKADAALIAILSGFTGTAMGQLGSVLNNTRTTPPEPTPTPVATPVEVINTPEKPVQTQEANP